jgi:hypothetical protein
MAMSGPRPSSELKLSAAARAGTLVSKNTVHVIEIIRSAANNQPCGERSFRWTGFQISFFQRWETFDPSRLGGFVGEECCGGPELTTGHCEMKPHATAAIPSTPAAEAMTTGSRLTKIVQR